MRLRVVPLSLKHSGPRGVEVAECDVAHSVRTHGKISEDHDFVARLDQLIDDDAADVAALPVTSTRMSPLVRGELQSKPTASHAAVWLESC
jgi:hypothetical protein